MTNLRWLKWKIAKYFRNQGYQVTLRTIKLGNTAIDGEAIGKGIRIASEIKTPRDDVDRTLTVQMLAHACITVNPSFYALSAQLTQDKKAENCCEEGR